MGEGVATATGLPTRIGRHAVLGFLATGGMAEIFLGKEPSGKPVVIKRILPHLARQRSFVSMFIDEARIGSLVHHPNVVEIFELGQVGLDLFLVMEYLAGENSSGMMRRLVGRGERLSHALAAHIVAEACAGLDAAHDLRDDAGTPLELVHRDVSPQNLFLTYTGEVKLLDFGIATAAHRLSQTATGQLKGKFSYMSPEQCRGEALDRRSDIFSLGVVLYELSTTRRLFKRSNELMVLKAVCEEPIPRPTREHAGFPPALEAICMRAMSRDRDRRYATAREMRDDLLEVVGSLGDGAPGEVLGAEMERLFADRIEEKRQMMSQVRSGTDLGFMPSAEVDEGVDVPQVSRVSASPRTATQAPTLSEGDAPKHGARLAVLLVLLVAAGGFATWWYYLRVPGGSGAPAIEASVTSPAAGRPASAPAAPAVNPTPGPAADPAALPVADPAVLPATDPAALPATILVHVETTPPGATVLLAGVSWGKTPVDLQLPAASAPVKLQLRRKGYADVIQSLPLDRDQRVIVTLSRPTKPGGKRPKPPDGDKDTGFHRFD